MGSILDNHAVLSSFPAPAKTALESLKSVVDTARDSMSVKRLNEMTSKFHTLRGAARDRKCLENGYLPLDEAKRRCLGCGHSGCVDEPNSNKAVYRNNIIKLAEHERKKQEDNAIWDAGGTVYNADGTVLKKNRQRPYRADIMVQECHCEQAGCTTKNGVVSIAECPIQCIDPSTRIRYGFDDDSNCMCPNCGCPCRMAWDVSACQNYIFTFNHNILPTLSPLY